MPIAVPATASSVSHRRSERGSGAENAARPDRTPLTSAYSATTATIVVRPISGHRMSTKPKRMPATPFAAIIFQARASVLSPSLAASSILLADPRLEGLARCRLSRHAFLLSGFSGPPRGPSARGRRAPSVTRFFCVFPCVVRGRVQRGQTLGCPVARLPECGDRGLGLLASLLRLRRCAHLEPLDRGIPVVQLRLDRLRERRRVVGQLRGQAVLGDRDVDLELPELARRPPRPSRGRPPRLTLPPPAACRTCAGDALASQPRLLSSAWPRSSSMCRRISASMSSVRSRCQRGTSCRSDVGLHDQPLVDDCQRSATDHAVAATPQWRARAPSRADAALTASGRSRCP